jgi:hypothetical protein
VPNNHSKYRITGVLLISGAPAGLQRDHRGASVHAPHSLAGQALDLHAVLSEEGLSGHSRLISPDSGESHFPLGRLERHGAQGTGFLGHVYHINPVRQGRIEPVPYVRDGTHCRQRNLQVLSFTCRPRRGRTSVRDLRMGRKSRRVRDGQPCPAYSALNRPRDISVTGESHPASFSVPDDKPLDDGRLISDACRAIGWPAGPRARWRLSA